MRRWINRIVMLVIGAAAMNASVSAGEKNTVTESKKHAGGHAVATVCPYQAATPYNVISVNRPMPNAALNMPNFTICCEFPNINLDPWVAPPCEWGGRFGCGWNGGCGAIFGQFNFGCGRGCNNSCDRGCGNSCSSGCRNNCDRGYRGWQRFSCGCENQCGCKTGCNHGCKSGCSAAVKPANDFEQVGFWTRNKAASPADDCLSCPPSGPKPKHTLPTASSLGCTGCSTWESERTFIFGSCRQFFGEPTHRWMSGK